MDDTASPFANKPWRCIFACYYYALIRYTV